MKGPSGYPERTGHAGTGTPSDPAQAVRWRRPVVTQANHNPLEGIGRHSVRIGAVEQPARHPAWDHDDRKPAPVSGGRLTRRRVTRPRESRDIWTEGPFIPRYPPPRTLDLIPPGWLLRLWVSCRLDHAAGREQAPWRFVVDGALHTDKTKAHHPHHSRPLSKIRTTCITVRISDTGTAWFGIRVRKFGAYTW